MRGSFGSKKSMVFFSGNILYTALFDKISKPGGFNLLRRWHDTVQSPMGNTPGIINDT